MAKPHKCPVCDGWGVRKVFEQEGTSCVTKEITCNACHGTGVVWEYEPIIIPSIWEPRKTDDPTPYKYEEPYTITWCDSDYYISEDDVSFYVTTEITSNLSGIE